MRIALLPVLALLPTVLAAQAPAAPPPPPFREGTAEASFVGTTGNSSTQAIGIGAELIIRPNPWETRFKLGYVKNEVGGTKSAEAISALARGQRKIGGSASLFAQYSYLADKFAGTSARHTVDIGIAGQLLLTARQSLAADVGGGYATDKQVAGTGKSTAIGSVGALYKLKVSETSDFTEEGRFVGAIPDGGDWRYTNTAALAAKVSTRLSLKASNTVRYVNRPVPGFHDTDVQTSIALVAKF